MDDEKVESADNEDSNESSLEESASATDSKPKNELRTLGFIDDEDSKDSSLSLKDKRALANGDDEGSGVIEALLNERRSMLGFVANGGDGKHGSYMMPNPEESPTRKVKRSQIEA